jgi:hypothetical protein
LGSRKVEGQRDLLEILTRFHPAVKICQPNYWKT